MICELCFNKTLKNIEIYHGNSNQKKAGVAILISKWTSKKITRDKETPHHDNKGAGYPGGHRNPKCVCI